MADRLEDLRLYPKMLAFCDAVDAILRGPEWRRDSDLQKQIADANSSVTANMEEGFEQPTDAAFAVYVYRSKGSAEEVLGRLKRAVRRRIVRQADVDPIDTMGDELCRIFGGFIKYLEASGFTDRGRRKERLKRLEKAARTAGRDSR